MIILWDLERFTLANSKAIPPYRICSCNWCMWEIAPLTRFMMLGQTHANRWSRVIASQNGGSTSYISPLRLGVLQWSRHLFNYWKNKKTIIEKFLILLIWNWIYIDHRKITWLWSLIQSKIKYMILFPSYNLEIEKLHG